MAAASANIWEGPFEAGADPWQTPTGDPWADAPLPGIARGGAAAVETPSATPHGVFQTPPTDAQTASARPHVYSTFTAGRESDHPSGRIIHDVPPTWDGKDPDHQAEPYLKTLAGWLITTRTLKTQQGLTILHYSQGDLKILINELDTPEITTENSGQKVWDLIKDAYKEYMTKELPKAIERALFSEETHRKKGEGMVQYVSRKKMLFRLLNKVKCNLPPAAEGYIMLRDARLPEKAWEMIETWTGGNKYEPELICDCLRKLERPVPGKGGSSAVIGFAEYTQDEKSSGHVGTPLRKSGGGSQVTRL